MCDWSGLGKMIAVFAVACLIAAFGLGVVVAKVFF